MESFSDVPRPFIIDPPLDGKTDYRIGDEMSFGLVLIGRAIELLPYFILAFEALGKNGLGKERGKFSLQSVKSEGNEVYRGEPGTLIGPPHIVSALDLPASLDTNGQRIRLGFLTPTRIKHNGKLANEPDFHILIRRLLQRISSLAYFHCGLTLDMDVKDMILAADDVSMAERDIRWREWYRYSGRKKAKMILGGFLGEATYIGDLERFMLLLLIGEYIHIGKATSFGFGKYALLPCTSGNM